MSKKINVDYFRNKLDKLPQVQLPKIKSRKIFSTKGPGENVPPPLPKEPPPTTIVDRSPVTISTISQMVDGAPTYDYSFGGAQVSNEVIERHQKEDDAASNQAAAKEDEKPSKGNLKFSDKLSKLSDFKFKNFLGKKTVVKTTMIQVDDYKAQYEEEQKEHGSDQDQDYEFDVDSLPSVSANPSRRGSESAPSGQPANNQSRRCSESASLGSEKPQSRRGSESESMRRGHSESEFMQQGHYEYKSIRRGHSETESIRRGHSETESMRRGHSEYESMRRGHSSTEIGLKSESFNNLDDLDELEEVPPNESSLYRIKERAEISASTGAVAIDIESPSKGATPTPSGNSKRTHKERFDNACGRAKKAVNSKLKKLKQLRSKNTQEQSQNQEETTAPKVPTRKPTCKKSVKKRVDAIKQESLDSVPSVRSEQESLESLDKDQSVEFEPPKPEWIAKRILSTESKSTPHVLRTQFRAQYSVESYESEREMVATRPAPPPPVAKLQKPPGDEWSPVRPVSKLQQRSSTEWGPAPMISKLRRTSEDEWAQKPPISKLRQTSEDEWAPAPSISKLRQTSQDEWAPAPPISKFRQASSEDEWGPAPPISKLRQASSEDEWGPAPTISKLRQSSEDEWGPAPPISKLRQTSEDEWGPAPPISKLRQTSEDEWRAPPVVSKFEQPPVDEWGPPPPLPKAKQPSLEDWIPEPPLPKLPLDEWGPPPPLPKVHQPGPDEWGPAPTLSKLNQPSLEEEWVHVEPLPKLDEWGPLPALSNQTTVLFQKISSSPGLTKGTFGEIPKGHLRKPSMDSNDSDSWIPETYRNMPRQQIGLNKIEENDTEAWSMQPMGGAAQALGGCNPKRVATRKSIDIFASDEEGEKAFEDFDDALKNVPVIPIGLRKDGTEKRPYVQLQPSLEFEQPQKPLVKQTSLTRQFSDEIEAKNLDIDVNKLINQFEPYPPLEIQKIQVMAIVETAELHYANTSPASPVEANVNRFDQPPAPIKSEEKHSIAAAPAVAPNPYGETFKAARSRRISAKEWAARSRATRSLESGAYASDEIFYSFEKEHHGATPASPPQRLVRRQVYRVDL